MAASNLLEESPDFIE